MVISKFMKELTLAVRHDNNLAFAEFDEDGNILHWKVKTQAKFIEESLGRELPYTWVLVVGKEEKDQTIICEVLETFPMDEYGDTINILNEPMFQLQASELLISYMKDHRCDVSAETIN